MVSKSGVGAVVVRSTIAVRLSKHSCLASSQTATPKDKAGLHEWPALSQSCGRHEAPLGRLQQRGSNALPPARYDNVER